MAIERGNRIGNCRLITREPQREQVNEREDDKRLTGLGTIQHQVKLVHKRGHLLRQLDTVGIDRHLVEPDVAVHIIGHKTNVVITRIGHAVTSQEGLNRLITKDKRLHLISFSADILYSTMTTGVDASSGCE